MNLPGETEAGSAGAQPCRGMSRWAHRNDGRGREDSFLRRPTSIGPRVPNALKIPARKPEYSLTENVVSPFHAEPRQCNCGSTGAQDVLLNLARAVLGSSVNIGKAAGASKCAMLFLAKSLSYSSVTLTSGNLADAKNLGTMMVMLRWKQPPATSVARFQWE